MNTQFFSKATARKKVCVADAGVDKDAMARTLKAVAHCMQGGFLCIGVKGVAEVLLALITDPSPAV